MTFAADRYFPVKAPFTFANRGDRTQRVQACLNALTVDQQSALVNGNYYGVIAVSNQNTHDEGTCVPSGLQQITIGDSTYTLGCVWIDPDNVGGATFNAHEIMHNFSLGHSYDNASNNCRAQPGEYCDRWDIMSALNVWYFTSSTWSGAWGGPGASAPNLLQMGWIPFSSQRTFGPNDGESTFVLHALSHPKIDQPLVVIMNVGDVYTVEFRENDGWDQGFATGALLAVRRAGGAVLVHQWQPNGTPVSILLQGPNEGGAVQGNTIVIPAQLGLFHMNVQKIDVGAGTATVSIGPGPHPPTPPHPVPPHGG
jgi:hypothetical protein